MNQKLITEFEKYVRQIQYDIDQEKNKKNRLGYSFRLKAIKNTLDVIRKFPDKITSSEQLKHIKGIGTSSLNHIDEILQVGKIGKVMDDILDQTYLNYVNELDKVYGIGPTKALEYYQNYGVKTIEDLKKLHKDGKIILPDNIAIGLEYYGLIKENIPREEMIEIDIYLHQILLTIDPQLFGIVCGSYRRMKATSNDIDILIVHPNLITEKQIKKSKINYLYEFVKILKKEKFIIASLTGDDVSTKYMGLCQLNDKLIRRIDIRFVPYESYYSATLYFTGSGDFNRKMRRVAESLGYKLNEYEIIENDTGNIIYFDSEKEIFDLLGMEYIDPEYRI
jgi:DNA polymerase/3'-5' exonuclease PolX